MQMISYAINSFLKQLARITSFKRWSGGYNFGLVLIISLFTHATMAQQSVIDPTYDNGIKLRLIIPYSAYEKINERIVNKAVSQGIPEYEINLSTSLNGDIYLYTQKEYLQTVLEILNSENIRSLRVATSLLRHQTVNADLNLLLSQKQQFIIELIARTNEIILESSQVDSSALKDLVLASDLQLMSTSEAPKRILLDGSINLAQMTAAERAWFEQLTRLLSAHQETLNKILNINKDPLRTSIEKNREYMKAVQTLTASYSVQEGRAFFIPKKEIEKQLSSTSSYENFLGESASLLYLEFDFSARGFTQYWNRINPNLLLPIYSYGLLASFDYVEKYPGFREGLYGSESMERTFILILEKYIKEKFKMDSMTQKTLSRIVNLSELHPLLRLSAYSILERGLGRQKAQDVAKFPSAEFNRLYESAGIRIVRSPTHRISFPRAHIDYKSDDKYLVENLVKIVEAVAVKRGIKSLDLPVRKQVYDKTKSSSRGMGEQLLERVLDRKQSQRSSTTTTVAKQTVGSETNSTIVLPPVVKDKNLVLFKGYSIRTLENGDIKITDSEGQHIKTIFYPKSMIDRRPTVEVGIINNSIVVKYPELSTARVYRYKGMEGLFERAFDFEPQEYINKRIQSQKTCSSLFSL